MQKVYQKFPSLRGQLLTLSWKTSQSPGFCHHLGLQAFRATLFKILTSRETLMFLVGERAALLMYYSKPCGADLNRKHCSPSLYWNEERGVYFLTIKTCELKLQHEDPWPLETNTLQIWGLHEAARRQPGLWGLTCGHSSWITGRLNHKWSQAWARPLLLIGVHRGRHFGQTAHLLSVCVFWAAPLPCHLGHARLLAFKQMAELTASRRFVRLCFYLFQQLLFLPLICAVQSGSPLTYFYLVWLLPFVSAL